jgi:hypothetical protein
MQGEAGPRGEQGPPGTLPTLEQIMPWLHMVFDAWEDHRQMRAREAQEREEALRLEQQQEVVERVAALIEADTAATDEPADDNDGEKKKKKRKHKNKDD